MPLKFAQITRNVCLVNGVLGATGVFAQNAVVSDIDIALSRECRTGAVHYVTQELPRRWESVIAIAPTRCTVCGQIGQMPAVVAVPSAGMHHGFGNAISQALTEGPCGVTMSSSMQQIAQPVLVASSSRSFVTTCRARDREKQNVNQWTAFSTSGTVGATLLARSFVKDIGPSVRSIAVVALPAKEARWKPSIV